MSEKISIHRALSELKLADKKIEKSIENLQIIGLTQKGQKVNQIYSEVDFERNAKAAIQSVEALIERKQKIKNAIILSNASTMVQVGKDKMTVAEAINKKQLVELQKKLQAKVAYDRRIYINRLASNNSTVEDEVNKIISQYNQQKPEEISETRNTLLNAKQYSLIDPLNSEKYLNELSNFIIEFESNVDAVLSESNAVTFIEI